MLTSTVDESLAALAHDDFVFSLLDVSLNGVDGTELLRLKIQGGNPGPIILLAVPAAPARLRQGGRGTCGGGAVAEGVDVDYPLCLRLQRGSGVPGWG